MQVQQTYLFWIWRVVYFERVSEVSPRYWAAEVSGLRVLFTGLEAKLKSPLATPTSFANTTRDRECNKILLQNIMALVQKQWAYFTDNLTALHSNQISIQNITGLLLRMFQFFLLISIYYLPAVNSIVSYDWVTFFLKKFSIYALHIIEPF